MNINDCTIIDLPVFRDPRGNLSFAEQLSQVPFIFKRVYWVYDVPGGEERGGHAYKKTDEFIIALSGSFDVVVDDGKERKSYTLNRSYYGLYIPRGIWRKIDNFSTNSLALEFASTDYDMKDYVRCYDDFIKMKDNEE